MLEVHVPKRCGGSSPLDRTNLLIVIALSVLNVIVRNSIVDSSQADLPDASQLSVRISSNSHNASRTQPRIRMISLRSVGV